MPAASNSKLASVHALFLKHYIISYAQITTKFNPATDVVEACYVITLCGCRVLSVHSGLNYNYLLKYE